MYVVSTSIRRELRRTDAPLLWRKVRRFNRPVQLAVAACDAVARYAEDPSTAALVALAPCRSGSPELFSSVMKLARRTPDDDSTFRVNPVHTLHAVDNLALSAMSIELENRAFGLGLGGAAGQAWEALEVVRERFEAGLEGEALLFGGDQESSETGGEALGAAVLLSRAPRRLAGTGPYARIAGVEWHDDEPAREAETLPAHAVRGLSSFLADLASGGIGAFRRTVQEPDRAERLRVTVFGEAFAELDPAEAATACAG